MPNDKSKISTSERGDYLNRPTKHNDSTNPSHGTTFEERAKHFLPFHDLSSAPDSSAQQANTSTSHEQPRMVNPEEEVSKIDSNLAKNLRKSFRIIAIEYRQKDNLHSTAPSLRNMIESQILLEVLSKPDWSNKLQEKGIEVNKPTLQLISRRLRRIDSPNLLDYNTAVRHFNETLDKFKIRDIEALQVEPAGLQGGAYYYYNRNSQQYYGFTITLKDPEGYEHVFDKGQHPQEIAYRTTKIINHFCNQYVALFYPNPNEQHPTSQQIEDLKLQYTQHKGKSLTENDIYNLQEGYNIHGWNCTKHTSFPLEKKVYYTDKGTKIDAIDLSNYNPRSTEEHNIAYPNHPLIDNPTPIFNCHSIFIDRKAWLIPDINDEHHGEQIQRILDDNEYSRVNNEDAKINDIVIYKQNENISHTAVITHIIGNNITVQSKLGDYGLIQHDIHDNQIKQMYGQPIIYYTNREGSHSLRKTHPKMLLDHLLSTEEQTPPDIHPLNHPGPSTETPHPYPTRGPQLEGQTLRDKLSSIPPLYQWGDETSPGIYLSHTSDPNNIRVLIPRIGGRNKYKDAFPHIKMLDQSIEFNTLKTRTSHRYQIAGNWHIKYIE